jgi:hypothetical protein
MGTFRLHRPPQAYPRKNDLKNIEANPTALNLTCQVDALLSGDISLSVQSGANGHLPVATITVSHALFGDGTYVYLIRATEDQLIHNFLLQAAFPPMS